MCHCTGQVGGVRAKGEPAGRQLIDLQVGVAVACIAEVIHDQAIAKRLADRHLVNMMPGGLNLYSISRERIACVRRFSGSLVYPMYMHGPEPKTSRELRGGRTATEANLERQIP